jgi:putative ABC transport system ATP-binding protein
MIKTEGLTFSYDQSKNFVFKDMKMDQGSHWLILGTSGSGKTTLLHLLTGLLKAGGGSIEVAGRDITRMSESERDAFRGKHMGLVFQKAHLIDVLSVEDNLAMAQYMAGVEQDKKRIREVLEELQLGDRLKAKPFELSQGEQQRVSIARAVLNKPSVIFADEPSSSLDDVNTEKVLNILQKQAGKYNATLVIVTHDQRLKGKIANQLTIDQV